MMGWWMAEEDQCHCGYPDDDETELQESSGVGTIIVIYAALAGIFIGANILPRQLTQSPQTLVERNMRKEQQQRRRSRHSANEVKRSRRNHVLDNWHDVQQPTAEEEAQWLQLQNKELYFDLPVDNIDLPVDNN